MSAKGEPSLRWEGPDSPEMVVAVVPVGGTHFDAALFIVRSARSRSVAPRLTIVGQDSASSPSMPADGSSRGAPTSNELLRADPAAAIDPDFPWRFWERGTHPGNIRIEGVDDASGRQATRSLVLLDLSAGIDVNDSTMPHPLRRALAVAIDASTDAAWRTTAAHLNRLGAFHRSRAGEVRTDDSRATPRPGKTIAVGRDASRTMPPLRDFRFAPTADLLRELDYAPGVLMMARPDLRPYNLGTDRLAEMASAFRSGNLSTFRRLHAQLAWTLANTRKIQAIAPDRRTASAVIDMIQGRGAGAGAVFLRDLLAPRGIVETLGARLDDPACHARYEAALGPLRGDDDWRLVGLALDPDSIRCPRTISEAKSGILTAASSARLRVLALDDTPLARGQALANLLSAAATNGYQPQLTQLALRTTRLADVLSRQVELGSIDPAASEAAIRLRRGARVLGGALDQARENQKGITGISGFLESLSVSSTGAAALAEGRISLPSGGRLSFRVHGERAREVQQAKPGDRVWFAPDEVRLPKARKTRQTDIDESSPGKARNHLPRPDVTSSGRDLRAESPEATSAAMPAIRKTDAPKMSSRKAAASDSVPDRPDPATASCVVVRFPLIAPGDRALGAPELDNGMGR